MTFVCALERSERPGTKRCHGQCPSCATWWPVESTREATARGAAQAEALAPVGQSENLGGRIAALLAESRVEKSERVTVCSRCGKGSTDNIDSQGRCATCGSPFLMLREVSFELDGASGD